MKNYLPKILITGGNGQVATSIANHPLAKKFHLMMCPRSAMDIGDMTSVQQAVSTSKPDMIINTAAYTAVDKAEQETELAIKANQIGALNLAICCHSNNIPLIHLSTDYVFDGLKSAPYYEEDEAHPINFYGESKWLGEEAIREECEQHIILRVSGVFSEHGNNFFKTILRLAKEKKELRIVADQTTCPTYAHDIATAIFALIDGKKVAGTYHFCSRTATSWYEFADAIVAAAKDFMPLSVEKIHPITTAEYPTAATRPPFSVLDCSKIWQDYEIIQPDWEVAIPQVLKQLGSA